MKAKIAILPGDGVGPEIVAEAVKVLEAVARRFGHDFEMTEHPVGGAAYDRCGDCLPETTPRFTASQIAAFREIVRETGLRNIITE